MSPVAEPTELAFVVGHLFEGRYFALASFVFILYDYLLTLDDEIRQFWTGSWNISRILFLCNRYFPPALMAFRIVTDFFPDKFPSQFCDNALRTNFPLNVIALAFVQGILALRMWYLFTSSRFTQRLILASYLVCTLGTIALMILSFPDLHSSLVRLPQDVGFYCLEPPASKFWLVFIPSFFLHAILCVFMVLRVVRNVRISKSLPLTQRLMKDGGFLYTVIFFSVTFSISAAIVGIAPSIGVLAMLANFMLALLSTCVSRIMLQISVLHKAYSLDPFSKDPIILLHTATMNRANWEQKMGCLVFVPRDVDMDSDDDSMMDVPKY